jgi:hypothetical protein
VSRKHPKWQLRTPAPMPEPPPSTPVAADDEQMAELMQLMGADAGPRMITAALADATPLDIEARRQLLSGYSLRPKVPLSAPSTRAWMRARKRPRTPPSRDSSFNLPQGISLPARPRHSMPVTS